MHFSSWSVLSGTRWDLQYSPSTGGTLCLPVHGPSDQSSYNLPLSSGFLRPFNRVSLIFLDITVKHGKSKKHPITPQYGGNTLLFVPCLGRIPPVSSTKSIYPCTPARAPLGHAPIARLLNCTHSHQAGESCPEEGGFAGHCIPASNL